MNGLKWIKNKLKEGWRKLKKQMEHNTQSDHKKFLFVSLIYHDW